MIARLVNHPATLEAVNARRGERISQCATTAKASKKHPRRISISLLIENFQLAIVSIKDSVYAISPGAAQGYPSFEVGVRQAPNSDK
jgi:hypothetical protein